MKGYKHILFATDLEDTSGPVGKRVKQLCDKFDAELYLVHVIEPIPAYGYPGFADLQSPIIEGAKEQMAKLGESLGVPSEKQLVEFGSVKTKVLHTAEELGIDLIIIGSHGRHGLQRLLGSSASAIVNGSFCDVLTVRCG